MSTHLRTNITAALAACAGGDLTANCSRLLDVLGYRSEKRFVLAPNSAQNFAATFGVDRPLHAAQARTEEWTEANLLFQLTDSEVAQTEQMHLLREDGGWNRGVYRSFLFLAIGLAGESYSRTALATITRAVNRLFMMPTPIFFRYGDKLTLAIILRRPGKRDASQDVLEKVTLIKDIDLRHPHAAHIRILEELALANLRQGQSVGNFDELQSAWARTLDISELNKRFYQELANWYYWAVSTVVFPDGDSRDDAETRNAVNVIRLVTRLIFVWFIKEKGLVPDDLFARDKIAAVLHDLSDDSDSYYKAILQNLFFATLNTEMNTAAQPRNRMFRSAAERGGFNRHYGVHSFYRYAALFRIDEASSQALFATIPFLNGGLFECLDRPEQGIRIDGFSDRADNPLHAPNVLFFGHARALDLNEVFGTRNKQYQVRGLFEIFRRYKFTIEENTPIDEEVALDPELLGKVFENLLAAYNPETRTTARKQTGSFYTPREIVDYMVDEALIAALEPSVTRASSLPAAGYEAQATDDNVTRASSLPAAAGHEAQATDDNVTRASSLPAAAGHEAQATDDNVTRASSLPAAGYEAQAADDNVTRASSLPAAGYEAQAADDDVTIFLNPNLPIVVYQRNLPHWRQKGVTYFVTFRLADSLPQQKLEQLRMERADWFKRHRPPYNEMEQTAYHRLFSKRVQDWLDAGEGACHLRNPQAAQVMADALRYFDGKRYRLGAWVVMPNHVHVLVTPLGDHELSSITHSWKSFTANQINKLVGRSGPLWMEESYDHIARNPEQLQAIEQYIIGNPQRAGVTVTQASILTHQSSLPTDPRLEARATVTQASSLTAHPSLPTGPRLEAWATVNARLRQLFAYTDEPHQFTADEVTALITAIDNAKILDLACGSGAFPMGVLHKLVFILRKLDPNNAGWKQQQLARAQRDRELAEQMEDEQNRDNAVKETDARIRDIEQSFDRQDHELDYTRKLYLIENCIYGVDIQPIAVQIAKLRFFISLVADQRVDDSRPNRNVRALPNLETKFVAANALIGLPRQGQMLLRNPEIDRLEGELRRVRQRHFTARTTATKKRYREEDARLRERIGELLQQDGWPKDMTVQLAHWDPYNQNAHAEFFDPEWMFGLTDGFNVVIGNPPYVRQEQLAALKPRLQAQYTCYTGTADLYVYFYERGLQLLQDDGVLTYISSNKYFRAGYGAKLRGHLASQTRIVQLTDFGDAPVFTAIAYPSIIVAQRAAATGHELQALTWPAGAPLEEFAATFRQRSFLIAQRELTADGWRLEVPSVLRLMEKLRAAGKPLGEYVGGRFYYGIKTGLNEAFVVDRATRDRLIAEHPSSADVLKPFLRGRDVKRWRIESADLWLIFIPWHFPFHENPSIVSASSEAERAFERQYPAVFKHLDKYRLMLADRDKSETGIRYEWYALQRYREYWHEFICPKIVMPAIVNNASFASDVAGYFGNDKVNICIPPSMEYTLAVLNSRVSWWFIKQVCASKQGGFFELKPMYLTQFPVPGCNDKKQIVEVVNSIFAAKAQNPAADVTAQEAAIDRLVYGLYGLTAAEIETVEGQP